MKQKRPQKQKSSKLKSKPQQKSTLIKNYKSNTFLSNFDKIFNFKEAKFFLEEIIKNIPLPIFIKDGKHRWIFLNDLFCDLMGHSGKYLLNKSDYDIFPKEQADVFWEKDNLVFETGETVVNEEKITWHNKVHTISTIKVPIVNPVDGKKYLFGIIHDLTNLLEIAEELQKARDESEIRVKKRTVELSATNKKLRSEIIERGRTVNMLNETTDRYRRLVELSPETVVVHRNGKVLYINQAGIKLFGLPSYFDAIGRNILDFVHPDYTELVKDRIQKSIKVQKINPIIEEKMLRTTGEVIDVEVTNAPITYFGESAVLVIIIDITEKKKILEELQRAHKLESLGVLAGGIAHDFNNLLTSILGNITLVKSMFTEEDKKFDILTKAENVTLRAKELTQQLLTFSKGGEPIKTVRSIGEIIKIIVNLIPKKENIKISYSIPADIWNVEIDDTQIFQVLNNIILNAQQAIINGGKITIGVENKIVGLDDHLPIAEGKYIVLSIHDTGTGIPTEHLNKIFDPYFTTKAKGDGLGLAIAYSVIKKHNGHINVTSTINKGTTFSIYLPATEKELQTKTEDDKNLKTGTGLILVMEDEKDIRDVLKGMLNALGYKTQFAKDGEQCLKLYQKALEINKPFDLVILDLIIPGGMGGEEAIKRLKEIDPNVKSIVTSGYANNFILANYKEHGFNDFIAKPYKMIDLSLVISKNINENPHNNIIQK